MNFLNDRATRDAVGHAEVIKLARAMLTDKDPAVRRAAADHLATISSAEVRKMVGALPNSKSPAGAAGVMHGPRAARGTKAASITGGSGAGGGGKAAKPASTTGRFAHLADASRFAAFAAASDAGEAEIGAAAERPQTFDDIPAGHGMRAAAIRNAILANAGRIPGAKSPEDVAAFAAAALAKARGQKVPVKAAVAAAAEPDMSTPEGVAAFVAATVAKFRGGRR